MRIIYDGLIFEKQRIGGISWVFSEIIHRVSHTACGEGILTPVHYISQ